MFCNTCILFFDLSFFGLGPEVESDQATQPLALFCPPNLVRKDKEWTHGGLKWRCKVGTCTIAYCAKWLLTKHLKEVHHSYDILGAGMLWKPKEARILTNFIDQPMNIGKHSRTKNVLTRCFTKNFQKF